MKFMQLLCTTYAYLGHLSAIHFHPRQTDGLLRCLVMFTTANLPNHKSVKRKAKCGRLRRCLTSGVAEFGSSGRCLITDYRVAEVDVNGPECDYIRPEHA